ncbi:Uncharacterised protein [Salmonella enterica subsp. enterica serovar Typhi]|nr:Uncharacterised protein [Salmonella enterica subsp. enterica serovar Typhi]
MMIQMNGQWQIVFTSQIARDRHNVTHSGIAKRAWCSGNDQR